MSPRPEGGRLREILEILARHQIARGLEKAVEAVVKNDADLAVDMGTTH